MTDLLESVENGVATLTLNRPERLNALSPVMTAGLKEALERLATDHEVGAIVITGAGRGWCAGGDVKTMEARGRDQTFEDRVEGLRRSHQLPLLIRTIPKVVIASINGPVAGAGLGLALACDLRIAGKSARFGTAFARIGYSGDYGGVAGKTFAKILRDNITGEMPTSAFWRAVTIDSDNRLAPLATDTTHYSFDAPAGAATIHVRLLYRRAFYELAQQKGWNDPDILMADQTLPIAAH